MLYFVNDIINDKGSRACKCSLPKITFPHDTREDNGNFDPMYDKEFDVIKICLSNLVTDGLAKSSFALAYKLVR